jgi:hypothetical protein
MLPVSHLYYMLSQLILPDLTMVKPLVKNENYEFHFMLFDFILLPYLYVVKC